MLFDGLVDSLSVRLVPLDLLVDEIVKEISQDPFSVIYLIFELASFPG